MKPEAVNFKEHKFLYHYQSFDPTKQCDRERLKVIISERKLFFSNPADFNDPWDCRPYYDFSNLSDSKVLEDHIKIYIQSTKAQRPDICENELQSRTAYFKDNPEFFEETLYEFNCAMWEEIEKTYRVYCLSLNSDNELMWAHYSNKHKGICLEFRTRNNLMCSALKVDYQKDYPKLNFADDGMSENLKPLFTKSQVWKYEDEYRLIAQETGAANSGGTLFSKNNYVDIPEGALPGIVVGCMSSDETVDAIQELVETSNNAINIMKATRAADRFELNIANI